LRVPWTSVLRLDDQALHVRADAVVADDGLLADDELLLRRDVLDAQVFDVAGKSLSRIADVRLVHDAGRLEVADVDVSVAGVAGRLGMRRLARRFARAPIPWSQMHLISGRGHGVMLSAGSAGIERLESSDVAGLIGRLPASTGAEILGSLPGDRAADALRRTNPSLAGEVVQALDHHAAKRILKSMPSDDIAAALRGLDPEERVRVLKVIPPRRVELLNRLLAGPARTAGGLMNPDVIVLSPSDRPEELAERIGRDPPHLDALLTVFVVDEERRVLGAIQPRHLIAGDLTPTPVATVTASAPFSEVIDRFALHDFLALAVTDDDGRLLGAVAVDDVLEELLAERLPGAQRRHTIRLGRRR
jgi:CBS domain-containing protein